MTGVLVERCDTCATAICPPRGVCRVCGGRQLSPVDVNGPMRVWSFTVNHHRWFRDLVVPVVVVLAELPSDPDVRLLGELVGAHDVRVGMMVQPHVGDGEGDDDDGRPVVRFTPAAPG